MELDLKEILKYPALRNTLVVLLIVLSISEIGWDRPYQFRKKEANTYNQENNKGVITNGNVSQQSNYNAPVTQIYGDTSSKAGNSTAKQLPANQSKASRAKKDTTQPIKSVNVTSVNQQGGQTAGTINNNYGK